MKTITLNIPDTQFWVVLNFLKLLEGAEITHSEKPSTMDLIAFSEIVKPLRKTITVADLCKEQQFQGINREKFSRLREELSIQESAEDLIALI